ncbi:MULTISPECIES: amino acid ABC transporter permease [unclassified Minwuia]|jgi:polar amino acid transport system permease protein|uniref:amino acid ABC transporter permease n=1 Tax=unclassified Minwuia TaxID=2618799 RepID=UPI00247AD061|nr:MULTISPECIES: amino acid ABC transporter permease [unclassified Minwuia]
MSDLLVMLFGKPMGIMLFQLLSATQYTIYLSAIAFAGGGLIGGLVTLARISGLKHLRRFASGYIWCFQSVPLLMLLFLSGLGVPRLLGQDVDPWISAMASLTIYASAYLAEVWRGAIQSIPSGQWEAGRALGMRFFAILRAIILPQALRVALAPTVGFSVQIIKGTSLAYIIGFQDLMNIGRRWANAPVDGTEPFIVFPLMALIYFALCFPLSRLALYLEHRLGTIGKTPQATTA